MKPHEFVLLVDSAPTAEQTNTLVRLADRPVVQSEPRAGTGRIQFTRDHPNVADAVVSAIRDVEAVGLRPVRLVNDDWVTLADAATRIDRSRETVRLWSVGKLGPGGFPPPLNPGRDTSFFSWAEIRTWLRERMTLDIPGPEPVLAALGLALQLRHLTPQIDRNDAVRDLLG